MKTIPQKHGFARYQSESQECGSGKIAGKRPATDEDSAPGQFRENVIGESRFQNTADEKTSRMKIPVGHTEVLDYNVLHPARVPQESPGSISLPGMVA